MFRITEDPSSKSLVQWLAKNYKSDSIVSVEPDMVGVMAAYSDPLCACVVHCIWRHFIYSELLKAAEMRFLRSVTGYTRLDKIRSEVIRQELEISGIRDLRLKYKQNWINHLERTDNTKLPKYALTYKPPGKKESRTPQETMATRRCRNRSNEITHGGKWWWWYLRVQFVSHSKHTTNLLPHR